HGRALRGVRAARCRDGRRDRRAACAAAPPARRAVRPRGAGAGLLRGLARSEEHTSELQSRFDLVCRLLLEKKKKNRVTFKIVENQRTQGIDASRLEPPTTPAREKCAVERSVLEYACEGGRGAIRIGRVLGQRTCVVCITLIYVSYN